MLLTWGSVVHSFALGSIFLGCACWMTEVVIYFSFVFHPLYSIVILNKDRVMKRPFLGHELCEHNYDFTPRYPL